MNMLLDNLKEFGIGIKDGLGEIVEGYNSYEEGMKLTINILERRANNLYPSDIQLKQLKQKINEQSNILKNFGQIIYTTTHICKTINYNIKLFLISRKYDSLS